MTKIEDVSKDQILGALPGLNFSDLMMIQASIEHLLNSAKPSSNNKEQELFDALTSSVGASMPYSALPTDSARRFGKAAPGFIKFLDTHFVGWDHNKITKMAFLRMLFTLLATDLKGRGVSPSVNIMIVNMGRMPEVFDNAFPGYLGAGLGHVILKQYATNN